LLAAPEFPIGGAASDGSRSTLSIAFLGIGFWLAATDFRITIPLGHQYLAVPIFCLFLISHYSRAGYDLLFCTNADSLGNCKGKGETFEWKGDKTALQLLVMNKDGVGTKKLKFMMFSMQNDKEGSLYADLSLTVIPGSLYAMKKLYFYKPGYYKVDVLDENNKYLTGGFITILDRRD